MPQFPPRREALRPARATNAEDGFLLVEVIVSALLVGLLVVATLTGFDVANRASADQRQHNEAAVVAAQSQEQMRSDPASALLALAPPGHSYAQTVAGTTYTITQTAELLPANGSTGSCSATESKRQSGNDFRITSSVTWPQLTQAHRPAVVASSIVAPPTGSALEVDAVNAAVPTAGVAGVTAIVTYTPVGGGGAVTLERTTESGGCVVFGGIPATSALVEFRETPGYVTRSGAKKAPSKEVKLAPNYTTHYSVLYNRAGAIKAEFKYSGSSEYTHLNNEGTTAIAESVTGDTFVALNAKMEASPDYELGSTRYGPGSGGLFEPLPGSPGAYEAAASTPTDLFPFAEGENGYWSVYAGDCPENNPETLSGKAVTLPAKVLVTPGGTTSVPVPMSHVTLNLYRGTKAQAEGLGSNRWKNLETTSSYPVSITNVKCAGAAPLNETAAKTKHTQETTTGPANGGHLAAPFQPFGEYTLCLYAAADNNKTFAATYTNKSVNGNGLNFYLGQRSAQEWTQQKSKEETEAAEAKAKRERTEGEARAAREAAEAAARTAAEEAEQAEKKQWERERKEGRISKSQLKEKENKQKEKRTAREAQESKQRGEAEAAETTARTKKESEEASASEAKRKARESEETAEASPGVTVESGTSGCP
jgi:type II secretory pathway pseudopilin PulG